MGRTRISELRRRRAIVAEELVKFTPIPVIAERLGVTVRTIYNDINAISEEVIQDAESSKAIAKFLLSFDRTTKKLIDLLNEAEDVETRRRILKDIRESAEQRVKILQSLGLVQKAPERFQHEVGFKVTIGGKKDTDSDSP